MLPIGNSQAGADALIALIGNVFHETRRTGTYLATDRWACGRLIRENENNSSRACYAIDALPA
jgi:hypothetical protein